MSAPEYKIVEAENADEMETKINAYIRAGWIPLGGIAATVTVDHDYWFAQALIHPEK